MRFRFQPSGTCWLALMVVALLPGTAFAQDRGRVEVAGGYSFMRDDDGDASFPRGWFASVGADLVGPLSVVGDASGSYKSMGGLDVDLSMSIHTFAGGPRVSWHGHRATPYVQMLFGVARIATTFELPEETLAAADQYFMMAPGGGLDLWLSERSAIRLGASLRLLRSEMSTPTGSEPFTYKEFQFIAGVVIR